MKQTPKEKAAELYSKFYYQTSADLTNRQMAIASALICIDEIIRANPTKANLVPALRGSKLIHESSIEYWQQVKEELQKM